MKTSRSTEGRSASERIDARIAELGDWRGETLSRMRELIREADPDVVEEWKWKGTPVWSHDGIVCTGEAYIAAMPGWKHDVGRRLDALIERTVADVRKAVRWNSPFYGVEGQGWFLCYHCFTRYVKVTFFRGTSLDPVPPVTGPRLLPPPGRTARAPTS